MISAVFLVILIFMFRKVKGEGNHQPAASNCYRYLLYRLQSELISLSSDTEKNLGCTKQIDLSEFFTNPALKLVKLVEFFIITFSLGS